MAITRPYYRIARPFLCKNNYDYLLDPRYAPDRASLCHAYLILQQDLERLFEYIGPADDNLSTYSHRTFELLLRACTEFEASCKAILNSNGFSSVKQWTIAEYQKIEQATYLSAYAASLCTWTPEPLQLRPFQDWASGHSLTWYQAYNRAKHDRSREFTCATLENAVTAIAGLLCILVAQFSIEAAAFYRSCGMYHTSRDDVGAETETEILGLPGVIFDVTRYRGWPEEERYDFDWESIKGEAEPYQQFPFNASAEHPGPDRSCGPGCR